MIILVGLAGALVAGGLFMLAREVGGVTATLSQRRPPLLGAMPALSPAVCRRVFVALAVGTAVLVMTHWPVASIGAGLGVVVVPKVTGSQESRRRIAVLEGLEQWIRRLSDMLTASRALEDALQVSAASCPAAVAKPVQELAARLSARAGIEEALRAFAATIDDPACDRIAAALIIATSRRGGAAHDVLAALAGMLARDVAARRQTEADRAEHRTTMRWIAVFMVGYTVYLLVNRSFSAPYGTVDGQVVLAVVGSMYGGAMFWLNRLAQIPAPGRFLNRDRGPRGYADPAPAPQVRRHAR